MNIKLSLKEDKEIRKEVHEIVVEQVKGIVRSEFRKIITDEVKRIFDKRCFTMNRWDDPIYSAIKYHASKKFDQQWVRSIHYKDFLSKKIDEIIENDKKNILPDEEEIIRVIKNKILGKLKEEE